MPLDENEGGAPTIFTYGDLQCFTMLNAIGTITEEDYETICKEVFVLRLFLAKTHGKAGAARALDRLKDKLQEIDQLISASLEDACLAEEEGEFALGREGTSGQVQAAPGRLQSLGR